MIFLATRHMTTPGAGRPASPRRRHVGHLGIRPPPSSYSSPWTLLFIKNHKHTHVHFSLKHIHTHKNNSIIQTLSFTFTNTHKLLIQSHYQLNTQKQIDVNTNIRTQKHTNAWMDACGSTQYYTFNIILFFPKHILSKLFHSPLLPLYKNIGRRYIISAKN